MDITPQNIKRLFAPFLSKILICVVKLIYSEIFLVCLVDPVTRADSDRSQAQKGSEALIHVSLIPLYGVFELMYSQ